MIHYNKINKKYILWMVIVGIWLIVCVIGNINVNKRFPKPIDEYYYLGDTVEYLGMQIKAEEILYKNDEGMINNYPEINIKKKEGRNWLVVKLDVKNVSDKVIDFETDILPNIAMVAYPIGYMNQGSAYALKDNKQWKFSLEEEKEVIIYFAVGNGQVRQERRKKFLESQFYLDFSLSPEHKAFVFNGVDSKI